MYDETVLRRLEEMTAEALRRKKQIIVAVDGRCASGKTSLAEALSQRLDCNVVHTDDFYLQPFQRTEERLSEAGGNLDRERLMKEVIKPLNEGREVSYRPLVCSTMTFSDVIRFEHESICIIEGSYSCHPELRDYYDITVFVTTDKKSQQERILLRNGEEKLKVFLSRWIPMEEKYFETFEVEKNTDLIIET